MSSKHPEPFGLLRFVGKWLSLGCVAGVLAGCASAFFLVALDWANVTRDSHRWLIWLLPVAGFCVGWMYLKFGKDVEGGNNLLIDEIHDPRKVIPVRMAPLILIGTVVSHLFGASVGREGTAVQMGGALADQLSKLFGLGGEDRRLLLMAGISGGFASVFGTPLAGAVFGLEVLAIGRLRYDALLPCFIAAIIGDQTVALLGVRHTHYSAGVIPALDFGGLAAALVAGALFGAVGMLFARATHALSGVVKRRITYPPLRPLLGGLLLAILFGGLGGIGGFDAWRYAGLGIPVIVEAFAHPLNAWDWLAKGAATVLSLGSGFKGGEVTPLFFIGATLGNALAPLLHMPFGLLAALGLVSVFAGAANTPLACTLMAIELFGAPIGVYAGVCCVVSYLCSGHTSIYRSQRVGHGKHLWLPEGIRLTEADAYRRPVVGATDDGIESLEKAPARAEDTARKDRPGARD